MPAFTPPPTAPQRGDRTTFSARVDAFLSWLVGLIPQLNTFIASLNARDLGGANTFVFNFETSTADSAPAAGGLRLGGTPQNTANTLRLSAIGAAGVDMAGVLSALGAVTSNVKGTVRLQKVNDPTAWMLMDVSAVATPTGYFNLAMVVRSASSPSPFAAGDSLAVFIDRNGDKGDSGGTPTSQQIRDAVGVVPIANGGTGANTAAGALANLGAMSASTAVILKGAGNDTSGTLIESPYVGNIAFTTGGTAGVDLAPLIIANGANNSASAVVRFVRRGAYGVIVGLDTDNKFKIGGDSMGGVAYEFWHAGNLNPNNKANLSGADFWGAISAPVVTQTSDERLKTNWRELSDEQLGMLASMTKAGLFDWVDGSGTSAGGSAQQIRAIVPGAVHDVDGTLRVDYGGLNFAIAQATLRRLKGLGLL